MLLQSMVLSSLDFCCTIYCGLSKAAINQLERLLKWCVRLLHGLKKRDSVTERMRNLGWLPVRLRAEYSLLKLTHKVIHTENSPGYLKELLTKYNPRRYLRSADQHLLCEHRVRHGLAGRSFYIYAPRLWNGLPGSLRTCVNYVTLKNT